MSLPKRLLVEDEELPKEVILEPAVEDELEEMVPGMSNIDDPKGVDTPALVPVVVAGGTWVPEEVPGVEDEDGNKKPDDGADDEATGNVKLPVLDVVDEVVAKPENGGVGVEEGFETGVVDTDEKTLVEFDGLSSNSF